jgi:nitrogen fixation NifU-like protein
LYRQRGASPIAYNAEMYSERLLDHFEHPRNAGQVDNPDVIIKRENPVCGDVLELSMRCTDGRVAEIRFRAKGCVPAMACGSAMTELALGRSLTGAGAITTEDLVAQVGGLPSASSHAAQLAIDALSAALARLSSTRL